MIIAIDQKLFYKHIISIDTFLSVFIINTMLEFPKPNKNIIYSEEAVRFGTGNGRGEIQHLLIFIHHGFLH